MKNSTFFFILFMVWALGSKAQNPVGTWSVKGTNTAQKSYTGEVAIKAESKEIYSLNWNLTSGEKYEGLGMVRGNNFYVSWGMQGEFGIVLYKIAPNGVLEGRWTAKSNSKVMGTETAKDKTVSGKTDNALVGIYKVEGNAGNGASNYTGTLQVSKAVKSGHYKFVWKIGNSTFDGVGFLNGNEIVVAWGIQNSYGVVHYVLNGNQGKGTWAVPTYQGILTEDIEKK